MAQPVIDNHTPFACEPLALTDEEGRPLLVLVVKATYLLKREGLMLAEEQVPVNVSGERWGTAEGASYRYEPECAFTKPATDVVLVGHAHAPASSISELQVTLQVGSLARSLNVVGERVWFRSMGSVTATKPHPFERMPLVYERAYGGWDRSAPDPSQHTFEPRNPVGVGFRASARHFEEGLRLPNLEDPKHPLRQFGQVVPPAGFGFISPEWQPRAALAGTYDEAWRKERMPWLPKDFDRRFFNAASPGLVASGYLRGDEPVLLVHAAPQARLSFRLPGQPPPRLQASFARGGNHKSSLQLDTCIIDTDVQRVFLLWRGHIPLQDGPEDVRAVAVEAEVLTPVPGASANRERPA
ncbi:DUF2169 domain-containing protein [Pyxidicoccus sp. 3LG]